MRRILIPAGILIALSLLILSSISLHLFFLQLSWLVLGGIFLAASFFVDARSILNYRWFIWGIYILAVLLIALTLFVAPVIRNTRSWLVMGPVRFQPVELMKLAMICAYSLYFAKRHLSVAHWGNILGSFFMFVLPATLVMLQPDLGSATILFGIWAGFLLVSGLPRERVLIGFVILALVGFAGWHFVLRPYQKDRIMGVFNPGKNQLGINYSTAQSKIAIGSAGWLGKGYKQGTQTQLGFLTDPATDYVLPALIEEWGMLAGFLAIGALLYLLFQILKLGMSLNSNFEKFLCVGVAMVFGLQFVINAGSALGLVPVIGLTFPFLSYGGSSILTDTLLLSMINSIAQRS